MTAKYQVYGNSISSQNGDYIISNHRTLRAAAKVAFKLNKRDCTDGGDLLWHIRDLDLVNSGETWKTIDYFDLFEVDFTGQGFVPVPKF